MKRFLAALALSACPALATNLAAQVAYGHRLPEGPERPVRERSYHIESYKAELAFDMEKETIAGTATITFQALRAPLATLSLDAADLAVTKVERGGRPQKFSTDAADFKLDVALDPPVADGESATVAIAYTVKPRTGMFFYPKSGKLLPQAWNYGEGGLHRGWLPIYNDTNDRFAIEFVVTVPRGSPRWRTAASPRLATTPTARGRFTGSRRARSRTTWSPSTWRSSRRSRCAMRRLARDGAARRLDASGTEEAARFVFGNTPDMVEYFSTKMGYPYPWDKYDQVVLREFSGAMETTTATGFSESELRRAGYLPDLSPDYESALPTFTYEDVVAHELAHHWFGDLVTCRSLGSIWLNESFATFWHTMWNAKAHGEDDLTYQRWAYLDRYVDYVRATGSVRPMEYLRWKDPAAMYQEETTYVKGALVLHMIRHFLGEADFDRMIAAYLQAARVLERRLGGLEGGHRARRRPEPDGILRRLDRRRRRAPPVRGVLPMVARTETGRPDGPADPVGSALRERFPHSRGRRDRRCERPEDPPRPALGLVDDGRAAGPDPPDAGHVRQGRLARLRGQVHPSDRGRPRGSSPGPTSRGSCARRVSSPRTFRRTRARSTRSRSASRIPPPTGDSSRKRPRISGRSAARRFSQR